MPTTTDKPLEGLPVNGVFPLSLSPAFIAALGKGKGAKDDVIGLKCTRLFPLSFRIYHPLLSSHVLFITPDRYRFGGYLARKGLMIDTFKPESITPKTEGRLDMDKGKASQLTFDTKVRLHLFLSLINAMWREADETERKPSIRYQR
jgi:hypothetical protein